MANPGDPDDPSGPALTPQDTAMGLATLMAMSRDKSGNVEPGNVDYKAQLDAQSKSIEAEIKSKVPAAAQGILLGKVKEQQEQLKKILAAFDSDNDGIITPEDVVRRAQVFDADKSGSASREEIEKAVRTTPGMDPRFVPMVAEFVEKAQAKSAPAPTPPALEGEVETAPPGPIPSGPPRVSARENALIGLTTVAELTGGAVGNVQLDLLMQAMGQRVDAQMGGAAVVNSNAETQQKAQAAKAFIGNALLSLDKNGDKIISVQEMAQSAQLLDTDGNRTADLGEIKRAMQEARLNPEGPKEQKEIKFIMDVQQQAAALTPATAPRPAPVAPPTPEEQEARQQATRGLFQMAQLSRTPSPTNSTARQMLQGFVDRRRGTWLTPAQRNQVKAEEADIVAQTLGTLDADNNNIVSVREMAMKARLLANKDGKVGPSEIQQALREINVDPASPEGEKAVRFIMNVQQKAGNLPGTPRPSYAPAVPGMPGKVTGPGGADALPPGTLAVTSPAAGAPQGNGFFSNPSNYIAPLVTAGVVMAFMGVGQTGMIIAALLAVASIFTSMASSKTGLFAPSTPAAPLVADGGTSPAVGTSMANSREAGESALQNARNQVNTGYNPPVDPSRSPSAPLYPAGSTNPALAPGGFRRT